MPASQIFQTRYEEAKTLHQTNPSKAIITAEALLHEYHLPLNLRMKSMLLITVSLRTWHEIEKYRIASTTMYNDLKAIWPSTSEPCKRRLRRYRKILDEVLEAQHEEWLGRAHYIHSPAMWDFASEYKIRQQEREVEEGRPLVLNRDLTWLQRREAYELEKEMRLQQEREEAWRHFEDKDGALWEEAEMLDKERMMRDAREGLEVQDKEKSDVAVKTEERAQSEQVEVEVEMVDVSTVVAEEPWK